MKNRFLKAGTLCIVYAMILSVSTACGQSDNKAAMTEPPLSRAATAASTAASTPVPGFDKENIVLTFAAMSDVHIDASGSYEGNTVYKFDNALKYIKELAGDNLDMLFFAGDITQRFSTSNYQLAVFKSVIEQNFNVADGEIEVVVGTGNHDTKDGIYDGMIVEQLGDDYYRTDLDKTGMLKGNRHCIVKGFHFITVEPSDYGSLQSGYVEGKTYSPVTFSGETLAWLDGVLAGISAEDPAKPVFIASHAMAHDTVYGSTTPGWYSEDIVPVLSKYPQAILFSGHMHNQLNNEKAIMQTSFTALDCGGVKYMGSGNIIDAWFTKSLNIGEEEKAQFSQGLLVEVDVNCNVRVRRLDFLHKAEIKEPWTIPAPRKDGAHLAAFSKARAEKSADPYFKDNAAIKIGMGKGDKVSVTFDAAQDDEMVYSYTIKITPADGTKAAATYHLSSCSFLYPKTEDMPERYSFEIPAPLPGKYSLSIQAVDIWDNISNCIAQEVTIQ